MKKLIRWIYPLIAGAIVASTIIIPKVGAYTPRDYNSNSIVYGGAYSVDELKGLLKTGVNRNNCRSNYTCPYQYANDLELLYGRLGMGSQYWNKLVDGTVFKDGHVEVGGKTVAKDVVTMGRHYLSGSTREPLITYTNVYWRSPKVSFNSNSIPAFVYVNYDGTMAFAIIKSCGNPVKGVGVREQTFRAYALKWIDENGNGKWDSNENTRQSGIKFTLTGNGENQTATTDSMGYAGFYRLKKGTYTITESVPAGYKSTTGTVKTLLVDHDKAVATFGNQKIPEPRFDLTVVKWLDLDSDQKVDEGEEYLPGWNFVVTGSDVNKSVTTDASGKATVSGLLDGEYRVKETMQDGWISTTGIEKTVIVKGGSVTVMFGNRPEPKKPEPSDTYVIKARKYEDVNGNGKHDSNEPWLANWRIKLSGNDVTLEYLTNDEGMVTFTDLEEGTYTVSETMQKGWKNITPISQQVTVPDQESLEGYAEFGNQKIAKKVTPKGKVEPLPTAGPVEMAGGIFGSISVFSAGAYYLKGKKSLAKSLRKF